MQRTLEDVNKVTHSNFPAAAAKGGVITPTPQNVVDRGIAEGLADIRAGRVHGPYDTVDEAMVAMKMQTKNQNGNKDKKPRHTR